MRKSLLLSFAVMFFVFAVYGGYASAQALLEPADSHKPSEKGKVLRAAENQRMELWLSGGMDKTYFLSNLIFLSDEEPSDSMKELDNKLKEIYKLWNEERREKFGDPLGDFPRDRLSELPEFMAAQQSMGNKAAWKALKETLSPEDAEKIEILAFQRLDGIFGGALAVENLTPLRLTEEQKEKVEKINEKIRLKYCELRIALNISVGDWLDEPNLEAHRKLNEEIISLARDGQKEIELLLTDKQKQRAEELMADLPEGVPFMSDYLKNHP